MVTANPFTRTRQTTDVASDIYGAVDRGTQGAETLGDFSGQLVGSMNQFVNPYYDQVIDAALGRMRDTRDENLMSVRDQAERAGAFGGARMALLEGDVMEDYTRSAGDMASQLYQRQFDTALGAAQGAEQQRLANLRTKTQAGQAFQDVADQYFTQGRTALQAQEAAGRQQQELAQAILTGGNQAFNQYTQSPMQALDLINAVLSGDPRQAATTSSQTSTTQPGMMDYLSMGLQTGARLLTAPTTGGGSVIGGKKA